MSIDTQEQATKMNHEFIPCTLPDCSEKAEHCQHTWCGAPRSHHKAAASPAERPAHTPLPWAVHESFKTCVIPIYDARKRLGGAADPDVEATSHAKIITWQEGSEYTKFYRSRVMKDEAIANAQFIVTACNNYEALQKSHKALMEAAEFFMDGYNSEDGMTSMKHYAWKFDSALANAKALEGK